MDIRIISQMNPAQTIAQADRSDDVVIIENNYYFSPDRVNMTNLKLTDRTYNCPYKGRCYWLDYVDGDVTVPNIAWVYDDPMNGYEIIKGRIAFYSRETTATRAVRD